MSRTFAVLVRNDPGVLARIAGLFARRGFQIDSLSVGTTEDERISRMTIVTTGDDQTMDQVKKQLAKHLDVLQVQDLTTRPSVEREMALIKVACTASERPNLMQIAEVFRASVIDLGPESVVVEITGNSDKVDALLELLVEFEITESLRTGKVAMTRGSNGMSWDVNDQISNTAGPETTPPNSTAHQGGEKIGEHVL